MSKYSSDNQGEDFLPNGRKRQEYYDAGLSDTDIEYWGLDQPGAPEPQAAHCSNSSGIETSASPTGNG